MSTTYTGTPLPPPTTAVTSGHHQGVILCVVVLLLLILVIGAITTAVVIYCVVRKRHKKQSVSYRPIPKDDSIDVLSKALGGAGNSSTGINLPFPPRVQMTASKISGVQPSYTQAGQISTGSEMSSEKFQSRYPFIQHRAPSPAVPPASKDEQRPPRLRTRRKGNHKHVRGKNIIVRRETTIDSSPTEGDESRDVSPAHQRSPMPASPHAFIVPAHHSPATGGTTGKGPEIFLNLNYTADTHDLIVRVERVESLPLRSDGNEVDAYVRVYFKPTRNPRKTSKTNMRRRSSAPVFDEDITFSNMNDEEMSLTTLYVEALDYKSYGKHVLLGRAELAMKDVDFGDNGQVHISLPLIPPPQVNESNGTVLLSLCFDPENRKLSLIVLRAKDLNNNRNETDPVAKVTVELKDRVLTKLKTKKKSTSCSPIFNEAVSCTVGMENIHDINITVIILNEHKSSRSKELGKIILGSGSTGEEQRHWNDILTTPGKHIAEWHELYPSS